MNSLTARHGLTKIKLALAAIAVACLGFAFAANNAKAASGDPFAVDFNYAGLTTGAAGEAIDTLVLKPSDGLGALEVRGAYTDDQGNFNLPKATGLTFPAIQVDVGGMATVDGAIELVEDGSGNYNDATGALTMNTKIALTLGVDDVAALGDQIGIPMGSGPLSCKIGPLDLALSTGNGWPHASSPFANKADLEDGAVAGYWDHKPDAVSPDPTKQYLCDLIGGLLDPVGGLWLANAADGVYTNDASMPAATSPKPPAKQCEAPLVGAYPDCNPPEEQTCEEGQTGTYPDCVTPAAKITKVTVSKAKVKAGKKAKVTVKVTNKGNKATTVTVKLKSSNKQVKIQKSVKIKVGAGKTAAAKVVVKTTKKAKGKATITATAAGKTGKGKVTVQKAKKKRK